MDLLKETLSRSQWSEHKDRRYPFYCPQCRAKRILPFPPNPFSMRYLIRALIATAFLTLAMWPLLSFKGIVAFFPIWGGIELVHRLRVRAVAACPYCGFDPYLYMLDVKKARGEMEQFWRNKFSERGWRYPGDVAAPQSAAAPPAAPDKTAVSKAATPPRTS